MAFRKSLRRSELIQLPCAASRRRELCSMRRRRHGAPSAPSHEEAGFKRSPSKYGGGHGEDTALRRRPPMQLRPEGDPRL